MISPGVCKRKGEILKAGLQSLAEKYPEIIQEVRGTGLMLAVEFHTCELGYETAKRSVCKTCHDSRYSC